MLGMVVCLVCGQYEEIGIRDSMKAGWVFTRCPECHRGTPLDIAMNYLAKSMGEMNVEGFCERHWFKESGICGYCKMKREEQAGSVT